MPVSNLKSSDRIFVPIPSAMCGNSTGHVHWGRQGYPASSFLTTALNITFVGTLPWESYFEQVSFFFTLALIILLFLMSHPLQKTKSLIQPWVSSPFLSSPPGAIERWWGFLRVTVSVGASLPHPSRTLFVPLPRRNYCIDSWLHYIKFSKEESGSPSVYCISEICLVSNSYSPVI